MNTQILLKATRGRQFVFADIQVPIGVRVSFNYTLGPNLAILKPVYLDIFRQQEPGGELITVTEKYDPDRHPDPGMIHGGAGFQNGLDELFVIPGLSARAGLSFDWGRYDSRIVTLDAGIILDGFIREVPLMAYADNRQFFFNFYISLSFGQRRQASED